MNIEQERTQTHRLVDLLSPEKLGAVRTLLEAIVDPGDDELTDDELRAVQAGLDSLDRNDGHSMEVILSDFGLTTEEFEKLPIG